MLITPLAAPVARVSPELVAALTKARELHANARKEVEATANAARFLEMHIGVTYQLQPGDLVEDDGTITRAAADPPRAAA